MPSVIQYAHICCVAELPAKCRAVCRKHKNQMVDKYFFFIVANPEVVECIYRSIDTVAEVLKYNAEPAGAPDIYHYGSSSEIKLGHLLAEVLLKRIGRSNRLFCRIAKGSAFRIGGVFPNQTRFIQNSY